jgi:hypothetical protein
VDLVAQWIEQQVVGAAQLASDRDQLGIEQVTEGDHRHVLAR